MEYRDLVNTNISSEIVTQISSRLTRAYPNKCRMLVANLDSKELIPKLKWKRNWLRYKRFVKNDNRIEYFKYVYGIVNIYKKIDKMGDINLNEGILRVHWLDTTWSNRFAHCREFIDTGIPVHKLRQVR